MTAPSPWSTAPSGPTDHHTCCRSPRRRAPATRAPHFLRWPDRRRDGALRVDDRDVEELPDGQQRDNAARCRVATRLERRFVHRSPACVRGDRAVRSLEQAGLVRRSGSSGQLASRSRSEPAMNRYAAAQRSGWAGCARSMRWVMNRAGRTGRCWTSAHSHMTAIAAERR